MNLSAIKSRLSTFTEISRSIIDGYPFISRLWAGIVIISIIVAGISSYLSNVLTRQLVVDPLFIGVITLFTISLTITTMGIQLASNRYSHRVDSSVLQLIPVGLHFLPHLLAILIGVLILSSAQFDIISFAPFIFFSVAAILSIFPFLLWLLKSLTPGEVLTISVNQIDDDYLNQLEEIAQQERKKFYDNPNSVQDTVYQEVTYSQTIPNDPVDIVSDIVRSSIAQDDTSTAKRVVNEYVDRLEPIIINRYREFKTSHSDSQLVCWYLYGPLEDVFRHALKYDNHVLTMEIILLLRESIISWHGEGRDVPEVFFRLFGQVTTDYATECDQRQLYTISSNYSSVAKAVAKDIDSPHTKINGATKYNFEDDCLAFALESIDQKSYKSARVINQGLRVIIEAQLRMPSINPKRTLLSMGLIGEAFAAEEARSRHIVGIAEEVSIMDEAEWTITTLVTFLDKIDEYGNGYTSRSEYRELVVGEIGRINNALESRDQNIAAQISERDSLVIEVMRASRFFRSSFTPEEVLEEMDAQIDVQKVAEICDALSEVNAMMNTNGSEYKTTYERI